MFRNRETLGSHPLHINVLQDQGLLETSAAQVKLIDVGNASRSRKTQSAGREMNEIER